MKEETLKLDEVDVKILEILQDDCTITAKELGGILKLSPTPVYERIKKLEKSGIIKKYVALVDAIKLNKKFTVFINMTIQSHTKVARNNFLKELSKLNEIAELYHTSGAHDFVAKAKFEDVADYRAFLVNQISAIPNISDIDSQIVLEEVICSTKVLVD
jgi:DNA-binding Lrp family transcriptional regulator